MTNKMLARYINSFKESRQDWIDILNNNPDSADAPKYIVEINAKIDLLRSFWNWREEGERP